jgi:hypothetical protein
MGYHGAAEVKKLIIVFRGVTQQSTAANFPSRLLDIHDLPRTVTDAVKAPQTPGKRFLWVDYFWII